MRVSLGCDTRTGLGNAGNLTQGVSGQGVIAERRICKGRSVGDQIHGASADHQAEAEADRHRPRAAIESQERSQSDRYTEHTQDVVRANAEDPPQG